jgi:superfamily II DNA/RNA helicase
MNSVPHAEDLGNVFRDESEQDVTVDVSVEDHMSVEDNVSLEIAAEEVPAEEESDEDVIDVSLMFDESVLAEHESDEFAEEDSDVEDDLDRRPHAESDEAEFDDALDEDDDFDDALDEDDDVAATLELTVDGDPIPPTPVDNTPSWTDLGVPNDLARSLEAEGIVKPFPIQSATLPDALAGRDICGEAPTGSGKTLAYGIAAINAVGEVRSRKPHALILVPVRELAEQTSRALQPISKVRRVWVQTCVGGVDIGRQANALRKGAGVVVATPGRLIDLLQHGDISFEDLKIVVIDEADRMADMGFLPQVEEILEGSTEREDRPQVLLFSATLDGDVGELIRRYQNNPVRHSTKGVGLNSEEDHVDTVGDHLRVLVRHENKLDIAAAIAEPARRSLVFVKNRFASERVADAISERGVPAAHLHGGLTQGARNRVITDWARGSIRTVVATDMVARGLHMDHVDVVIHVDAPQDEKDYIHRSGRTGRAGAAGTVVNLLRKESRRFADQMERRLKVTSRTNS